MVSCLLIYFILLCLYHGQWVTFRRNLFYARFTTSPVVIGLFRVIEGGLVFIGPFLVLGANMFLMYKVMGNVSSAQSFFGRADWTSGWIEFSFIILNLFLIWTLMILWLAIDTIWSIRSISDEFPQSPALKISSACVDLWARISARVLPLLSRRRSRRRKDRTSIESFMGRMLVVRFLGSVIAIALYFIVPNHTHIVAYYITGGIASAVCLSAALATTGAASGNVMVLLNRLGNEWEDD